MNDMSNFKLWLTENKKYSAKTISNIVSRFKRANSLLPWFNKSVYLFNLEQLENFKSIPESVRSQIKKAVKLYFEFSNAVPIYMDNRKGSNMKVLSLFANIGVAEAYLRDIGFDVEIANELVERRALLYSKIYPHTHMICGDITDKKVFQSIVDEATAAGIDIIMATPPCQGISTVGQQRADDVRNLLVCQVIEAVKKICPKYVLIENVPGFFKTKIIIDNEEILIPDLLDRELSDKYNIHKEIIDTKYYSVPQTRERALILMTRNDQTLQWCVPPKDKKIVTMRETIGHLPKLDPFISDVDDEELIRIFPHYYERADIAKKISRWHIPPCHIKRQVVAMQHTPSGQTAFDNKKYYPVKSDGTPVKGFKNTYKRQNWDTPAYTVTMDNRKISSQNNVHPGKLEYVDENGEEIYSDARTLTLYEIMRIMSIPDNWPVPDDTSEAFLRRIIGEGIPPLFVKKVFENLKQE